MPFPYREITGPGKPVCHVNPSETLFLHGLFIQVKNI